MKATAHSSSHVHVRHYRERMYAQGFKQRQIWLPDTKSKKFLLECRKQSLLATRHETSGTLAWLDETIKHIEDWKA